MSTIICLLRNLFLWQWTGMTRRKRWNLFCMPTEVFKFFGIVQLVCLSHLFLACAVDDEILPPAFLTKGKKTLAESSKCQAAEKSCLSTPHHVELVERKWGGTTHITVEEVKMKMTVLLREDAEKGDTAEVMKRALILAVDIQTAGPLILKLLKKASEEFLITPGQTAKGLLGSLCLLFWERISLCFSILLALTNSRYVCDSEIFIFP